MSRRRFVVGVSGATGAGYAQRLLAFMADHREALDLDCDVVFSKYGRLVWNEEVGHDPGIYGFSIYRAGDMTAPFASGSAPYDGMAICPCSAGALGRIATGVSADLVGRAADVMLKERRKLVLVLRESPLSLIAARNIVTVTEAGAVVLPAGPSFYSHPEDRTALLDTVVARVLDQLGVDNSLMVRWEGELQNAHSRRSQQKEEV